MTLPFENDTHKVEKRLAKRSLVTDRRRNLFVIITITLAVCLMSSIAFAFSGQNAKSLEAIQGQYQSGCVEQSFADIDLKYAAVIAGLTYIVLLFATRKPLKLVGKVSAIEAVRATAYSQGGGRAVSRQLHRRLTMPRLAAMNFLRNPKKAVMTCISLGMTGIMAISIAAYVNSIDAAEMAKAGLGDGGSYLLIYKDSMIGQEFVEIQQENPLNEAVREQLLNLPGVDYLTSYSVAGIQTDLPKNEEPLSVRGITAEQLKTAVIDGKLKEGEAEYEELLANDGVLVVKTSDNLMEKLYGADYALGDSVTFTSFSGGTKTYTVRGILDTIPGSGSVEFFVLPEEELHTLYQDINDFVTAVNIHTTEDNSQLRQDIFDVVMDQNVEINCITDYIAELESQLQVLVFPLYGLLFFIFIFALLNLANTLITSLLSRQRIWCIPVGGDEQQAAFKDAFL